MPATLIARGGRRQSFNVLKAKRSLHTPRESCISPPVARPTNEEESTDANTSSFRHLTAPTWSVHELLSTYPAPKLEPEALTRLHKVSALVAPDEDSDAFKTLKGEMEELIRLVEAVKLVDTTGIPSDGRIWPVDRGIDLEAARANNEVSTGEQDILRHAAKTVNGYYAVDTPPSGRRK